MRLVTVFICATFPSIALAQPSTPSDTSGGDIDRVFDAYRGTSVPGCAVGVSRAGRVALERAYGMANLETGTPIEPGTIFHVASVSKQFTAAAIMILAREGRLSLDDDIRKHLPEIPDYGTKITIRHLLHHTSGLRDQWDLLSLARGRFEENRITEADVMDIVPRQKALNFAPGTEYLYSNTGFTLAAVIVKRVSGKSLRDFAHERIFVPLGMTKTHFHDDYTMVVPGRAWAYAPRGNGFRASIPNYDTYGATSLFTTVGDLLKWQANFDTLRVGDAAMFTEMQTPSVLLSGDTTGYGLGLSISRYRGARAVGHGGADAGYRSFVVRFPEHKLAIALACNTSTANTGALANRIADIYLGSALASSAPAVTPQGISVPLSELEKHAGVYFSPERVQFAELVLRDGKLFVGRAANNQLIPVAPNRFRATMGENEYVFRNDGVDMVAPGGRVVGRMARMETRPPSHSLMQQYAGQYSSEELNATYRVTANDSTITLQTGTSDPITGRLVFADAFSARNYTVIFSRSGRNVTGFEITTGRARRVKFTKVR
jgi:CubicO group peptidase (beta-lactamase class C family)